LQRHEEGSTAGSAQNRGQMQAAGGRLIKPFTRAGWARWMLHFRRVVIRMVARALG
jgi:hypothetical protein